MNRFSPRRGPRKPQQTSQQQPAERSPDRAQNTQRPADQGPNRPHDRPKDRSNGQTNRQPNQRPNQQSNQQPNQQQEQRTGNRQPQKSPPRNGERPNGQQQQQQPRRNNQRPRNRPNHPRERKSIFDELFDKVAKARSDYFEKYGRVSDREREQLKKNYDNHLQKLRSFEDQMTTQERENYFNLRGPQRLDLSYASAHNLDPQLTQILPNATLEAKDLLAPEHREKLAPYLQQTAEQQNEQKENASSDPVVITNEPWNPDIDPHYLMQQKQNDFSEDKEESMGTYEDYLQAKQFSVKAPKVKSMS